MIIIADRYLPPCIADTDTFNVSLKSSEDSKVLSVIVPFELEKPSAAVENLLKGTSFSTTLSTVFNKNASPESIEGLRWALQTGHTVDIDIQATLSDSLLEGFEDLIAKAAIGLEVVPPIVLCASIVQSLSF